MVSVLVLHDGIKHIPLHPAKKAFRQTVLGSERFPDALKQWGNAVLFGFQNERVPVLVF